MDRTTRWGTAVLMSDSTAECTSFLELVSSLGPPVTIIIDQGVKFEPWAMEEEMHQSPAELVYGEDLRLPGQLVAPVPGGHFLAFRPSLQQAMANLQVILPRIYPSCPTHFPADLYDAAAVFLRTSTTTVSFQPPYTGQYHVLHQSEKYFTLEVKAARTSLMR